MWNSTLGEMKSNTARSAKHLRVWQVDVFTSRPLYGNPLGVVFCKEQLAADIRQAIAREMNLSETVFLTAPAKGGDFSLCIHTVQREIPFAVHPAIGAAHAFAQAAGYVGDQIQMECQAGVIPIRRHCNSVPGWFVQLPSPHFSPSDVTLDVAASWFELRDDAFARRPIEVVWSGVPWLMVEVLDSSHLSALKPDHKEIALATHRNHAVGITVFARTSSSAVSARMRSFAPAEGIYEDPVCGSCAGSLAALLNRDYPSFFQDVMLFEQGLEIKRAGTVYAVRQAPNYAVGGEAVTVFQGKMVIEAGHLGQKTA
jgi:PhzF family phenazine biosynthesis protein